MIKIPLALPFFFASSISWAQSLSVIVPALSGYRDSRDSHFNWQFTSSGGGAVEIGQFACGSYWVAPASGDSGITVLSLKGNPAWNDLVSCDADPLTERHGLLDGSNGYGSYEETEDITQNLPVTFSPANGSCVSLVAAMQRNEMETGAGGTRAIEGEVVDAYCVVTLLPEPPPNGGADMIRPNITGATKEFLTWDHFDLERLPGYAFITGKSAAEWEDVRVRWGHSTEIFGMLAETSPGNFEKYSEGGRAFRSAILIDDYGAGAAQAFNNDLLALFSTHGSLEEKKPALAAMLAYGLDIYHNRYNYGSAQRKAWSSGAGQSLGTFLPPVFAASLLRDETKANVLKNVAITNHDPDVSKRGPHELRQQTRGVTGVLLWGDGVPFIRNGNNLSIDEKAYWGRLALSSCFDGAINPCDINGGSKTLADPYGYIDGPPNTPGAFYMGTAAGGIRSFAAAMILMPEIRATVNTDDPIEYADRVSRHGVWTAPDPLAIPSVESQELECNVYRDDCPGFGTTWGANPTDIRFAIEDGSGRFTSKHGAAVNISYEASRSRDNWDSIIARYDGPTFEDRLVSPGTLVSPEILFEYGNTPRVHLRCPNPGATIRFTVDGSEPSAQSALYTGPLELEANTTVRAQAFQNGKITSSVSAKTYLPDAAEQKRTWASETIAEDGLLNTRFSLGWLYFRSTGEWAWSYSLLKWIYAPDPGLQSAGAWIYVPQ
jgi:hypothetical protein